MKLPPVLYHGTSTLYIAQILRDGLRPESSYKGFLCYTDDLDIATWHAGEMAEWQDAYPVVFSVPINRFRRRSFCLETGFIILGPSAGRALKIDVSSIRDWQEMLRVSGAVGYRKTMKVSIDDVHPDYRLKAFIIDDMSKALRRDLEARE